MTPEQKFVHNIFYAFNTVSQMEKSDLKNIAWFKSYGHFKNFDDVIGAVTFPLG